jgi:tetratricopeptide (TPR) repeat protein
VALREAVMHYRAALALLPALQLQDSADDVELDLQLKLGNLLMQIEGFGSAATVASHTRARELAKRLGKNDKCVLACSGIAASLWSAGRFDDVLGVLAQLAGDDPAGLRPISRVFLAILTGLARQSLGALREAREATNDALRELASIPPEARQDINGVDPMVLALAQSVSLSVHEGRLEQADADTRAALQIAQARDHAPTRAWALSMARWMAYRHGEMEESIRLAQQVLDLSERMGFSTRLGSGRILMGRAIVAAGRVDEGARLLHEGFAMWTSAGGRAGTTEFASIAADALIEAGRVADAEVFVRAGEEFQAAVPERHFSAELARLRARLWQSAGDAGAAESCYRQALAIADGQGARLFALRAATDLARLLHEQGRSSEAEAVLRPVLDALPEGREQTDAQRARATLQAAAAPRAVSRAGAG